jgi:uncharacterized protein
VDAALSQLAAGFRGRLRARGQRAGAGATLTRGSTGRRPGPHRRDGAVAALTQFAQAEDLEAAQITAVGAFEHAVVGWFDRAAKDYRRIPVDQQREVLSLLGDVAEGADGPILHMHVVLGLSDGATRGGHLLEGKVFPTLEVIVTETPAELGKVLQPDLGIALIDLDQSES